MNKSQLIFESIKALFSVLTFFVAIYGINTWRKQLKGTSQFELAKEMLENAYKVKRAFLHVRSPGIFKSEYPQELQNKINLTPKEDSYAASYYYNERLKVFHEEFDKLEESFRKGMVLFDKTDKIILPLRKCRSTLLIALRELIELKKDPTYVSVERRKEIYIIISDNLLDELNIDQFSKYINEAIDLIVRWLKPMLLNLKVKKKELDKLINQATSYEIVFRNDV